MFLLKVIALLYTALVAYRYLNTGGLEETKEAIAYYVPHKSLNLGKVVADPERQANWRPVLINRKWYC